MRSSSNACIGPRPARRRATATPAVAEVEAEWRAPLGERRWTQLKGALTRLRAITDPYR